MPYNLKDMCGRFGGKYRFHCPSRRKTVNVEVNSLPETSKPVCNQTTRRQPSEDSNSHHCNHPKPHP